MGLDVMVVAQFALATYSAYSALKALGEGDLLGAVIAGVGAYVGYTGAMSSLSAMNSSAQLTSETAAQGLATEGAGISAANAGSVAGVESAGVAGTGITSGEILGTTGVGAFDAGTLAATTAAPAIAAPTMANGFLGTLAPEATAAATGGFDIASSIAAPTVTSAATGLVDSIKEGLSSPFATAKGALTKLTDGTVADSAGNLFSGDGMVKLGVLQAGLGYLQADKTADAQIKIAEDNRNAQQKLYDENLARRSYQAPLGGVLRSSAKDSVQTQLA